MKRYGTVIRLLPDHRDTSPRLHAEVWPAVERTPRDANIHLSVELA
jgi:L-rhamnose mutarotase